MPPVTPFFDPEDPEVSEATLIENALWALAEIEGASGTAEIASGTIRKASVRSNLSGGFSFRQPYPNAHYPQA